MSETTSMIPSAPEPAPVVPHPPAPRGRGLGIAALVVGVLALVCAVIPGLSFVAFIPGGIAAVLGVIGLATKSPAFGQSLAGLILGPVAIIVAIVVSVAFIASNATPDVSAGAPVTNSNSKPTSKPEPVAPPAAEAGTRDNPAPFGSTVEISDNSGPIWNITLGAANLNAGDVIAAENQFNAAADAGFQYVIVPVTYTYVGKTTGTPWLDTDIVFVAAAGTTHEQEFVVAPTPITDISELYPGASATGNLVVMAPTADIEKGTWAIGPRFGDKFFVAVQ
ncbi:MAG: hypothetical protein PSV22_06105 [Pseudolabrys sp.]|nr:hypothetical protein [Pseudolabrys sp.]